MEESTQEMTRELQKRDFRINELEQELARGQEVVEKHVSAIKALQETHKKEKMQLKQEILEHEKTLEATSAEKNREIAQRNFVRSERDKKEKENGDLLGEIKKLKLEIAAKDSYSKHVFDFLSNV